VGWVSSCSVGISSIRRLRGRSLAGHDSTKGEGGLVVRDEAKASFGGEHRPFEWGWRAVGLRFPCLRWRGSCAGGCVPLVAVPALCWVGKVSLGGEHTN